MNIGWLPFALVSISLVCLILILIRCGHVQNGTKCEYIGAATTPKKLKSLYSIYCKK